MARSSLVGMGDHSFAIRIYRYVDDTKLAPYRRGYPGFPCLCTFNLVSLVWLSQRVATTERGGGTTVHLPGEAEAMAIAAEGGRRGGAKKLQVTPTRRKKTE